MSFTRSSMSKQPARSSAKEVGSMPYSSGGRPATAFRATLEISWPSYTQALVPSSRVMNFGARSTYFGGEPAVEDVRRLDHVVVHADQHHVVHVH